MLHPRRQLPDPHKILLGSGKQTRFIRIESAKVLASPEVEALIAAASCSVEDTVAGDGKKKTHYPIGFGETEASPQDRRNKNLASLPRRRHDS